MPNRSIISLAILKANWDIRHFDYIENFIPFSSNLIKIKQYKEIDINTFKDDFEKEYGLYIPYHPIKTILTRLKKNELIYKEGQRYFVNNNKNNSSNFDIVSSDQQRKLTKLTYSLIDYSKNKHNIDLTDDSAEKALLAFFQENELGFLFATKEQNIIPNTGVSKSNKYLVARFVQEAKDANPEIFNFLVDIATGAALATTILYGENLKNFSGKFKNLNLYLDTGYLLSLLGVDGEEKKRAFTELTQTLVDADSKLFVFEHTYNEVMQILHNALHWMNQGNYDIQKASRALRHFLANDFKATDVGMFVVQVPDIFNKYKIQKVSKPSYSKEIQYQISEAELKELIVNSYKNDPFFDETQKDETINKDIESIYSICKLRRGAITYTLKDASHIFITTNINLAHISSGIQSSDNAPFSIPPCITDVFIGTLIWLQNPIKTSVLNEKKLIANAYAAVQPDIALIKKYLEEVDSLKKKGEISDNEYYIFRTNSVAFNLLSEKTKNDSHNFEPKTTREIMDEINKIHLAGLKEQLDYKTKLVVQKTDELNDYKKLLQEKEKETVIFTRKYEKSINIFALFVTWFVFPLIVIITAFFIIINSFPSYFKNEFLQIVALIFIIIITLSGYNIFKIRKWLFIKIKKFLVEKIVK